MPKYPGLGLDLRYHDQTQGHHDIYPMAHSINCLGSTSRMLPVKEVAMMVIMDRLTDKPDFHVKIFDDAICEKYIEEALAIPADELWDDIICNKYDDEWYATKQYPTRLKSILDRECLEFCIKELRAKADFYKKTQLIPTLDASASVVKSDSIVDETLRTRLREAFVRLKADQDSKPDWHPGTHERFQNLVHPSLYPLVYGRTRVIADEVVGIEDAIDKWAGKGEIIPEPEALENGGPPSPDPDGAELGTSSWSVRYQWLPSDLKLDDEGRFRFTSYINNLHPHRYRDMYGVIENLVDRAIPAWDACLARLRLRDRKWVGACRTESRFDYPKYTNDETEGFWTMPFPAQPVSDDNYNPRVYVREYRRTRAYIDWCKSADAIQPKVPDFEPWDYGTKPGMSLREQFSNLQVIVKLVSIELGPDNSPLYAGDWHVEGEMNEHIVGTALYYLDSENVTPSYLSFRMQTRYQAWEDLGGRHQQTWEWMERVYGTCLNHEAPCLQTYNRLETKPGRLVAFPNVFHHHASGFDLVDKTKPGHRRFIALWLVDPFTRIISTANVPPQQRDWYLDAIFNKAKPETGSRIPPALAQLIVEKESGYPGLEKIANGGKGLPRELLDMMKDDFEAALPMSLDEAKHHREQLMEDRVRNKGRLDPFEECAVYNFYAYY